jgi:deazaflavin-dependent oxidoreductase (nitroreductase family)
MTESNPDAEAMKAFNDGVIAEFRANGGKVGGPFEGGNMVLLTTKGAKTGQPRLVPLAYVPIDGRIIIVGSLAGAPVDPQWVRNLRADSSAFIEVGTEAYEAVAQELPREERDVLWPKVITAAPVFADYQSKTTRVIPLFELTRV